MTDHTTSEWSGYDSQYSPYRLIHSAIEPIKTHLHKTYRCRLITAPAIALLVDDSLCRLTARGPVNGYRCRTVAEPGRALASRQLSDCQSNCDEAQADRSLIVSKEKQYYNNSVCSFMNYILLSYLS
jgi:hypothetical protein